MLYNDYCWKRWVSQPVARLLGSHSLSTVDSKTDDDDHNLNTFIIPRDY